MSAEQLTIFDLLNQEEALPGNIKLLSLFSGIGAFEKALYNLGISYELINYCEIDKYASKSYSAIHGVSENMNLWDVTKIREKDLPKDLDLFTYGFPCQDISLAGKQKGLFNGDGTKTRSGLFFDALRCIEAAQPRVAIAENVKNLVGKKFNAQFQVVLASLEAAGYNNYWAVLNLRDFGIPQNRERVFIVSIYKDFDKGLFEFPKGFPLEKRLKDVLEDKVDEKYYLSDKMIRYLEGLKAECAVNGNGFGYQPTTGEGVAKTIQANAQVRSTDTLKQCGQIYPNSGNPQAGRIYDANGISPTMGTCSGGNGMPKVVEPIPDHANKYFLSDKMKKYINSYNDKYSVSDGNLVINPNIARTVTTKEGITRADASSYISTDLPQNQNVAGMDLIPLRIRKLTPKECWRLMGFDDSDFHKAELVNSNTQLYKQAGNSIGVPVIEYIIKQLLKCEIWE